MRILIDGYNIIRRIPELKEAERIDLEEGRKTLLEELRLYRLGKGHRITVVFDGAEAGRLGGNLEMERGITVRFSPRGSDADRLILEAVRRKEADILVSADRELSDAAVRYDITAVRPELFWDKVQEEIYRRLKGEELEEQYGGLRVEGGKKLTKAKRKDRGRIDKL
jgi:predicted RNA-binding protein with PIN domain